MVWKGYEQRGSNAAAQCKSLLGGSIALLFGGLFDVDLP